MKKKYRITITFRILIFQFILCFIGLAIGYTWGINIENEKWSKLIYKNIKIGDFDIGGKTKQEAKNIIKSKYIDEILKKKLFVTTVDKVYSIENSHLIKSYDLDTAIDNAFNFGKNLNIYEKHMLIKRGSGKNYSLVFACDNNSVKEFTRTIEKKVNINPVNASIKFNVEGTIKINNDTEGYKLEKEKLEKYVENKIQAGIKEDIYIKAPVKQTEAAITKAALSSIHTKISSFSTSFKTSSHKRANNIDISVKAINGTLLMPHEVFSFNERVGERNKERGYMEAPVIINSKVESGIGGGICQVSSTLYNAVLEAGIHIIERVHHSLPSKYIGIGLDATVYWDNIDFKFENTLDYPIYIEAYTKNKNIYFNIFSNPSLNKKKYVIENNIDVRGKRNGYKVKVIRKAYENKLLISSEVISNDFYAPLAYIHKRSAK